MPTFAAQLSRQVFNLLDRIFVLDEEQRITIQQVRRSLCGMGTAADLASRLHQLHVSMGSVFHLQWPAYCTCKMHHIPLTTPDWPL